MSYNVSFYIKECSNVFRFNSRFIRLARLFPWSCAPLMYTKIFIHVFAIIYYNERTKNFLVLRFNTKLFNKGTIAFSYLSRCCTGYFKVGLLSSKKNFVLFTSLKALQKMMKNAFYFILKGLFVLKIFNFCHDFLVM